MHYELCIMNCLQPYSVSPRYFLRVAIPPRMCRSALLRSSTCFTRRYSARLQCARRSLRSLCTVDLLMPNCFAAARTVALFSIMYTARSQARCSIVSLMVDTSQAVHCLTIVFGAADTYEGGFATCASGAECV